MEIEFYDIRLCGSVADAQYFITDENGNTANVQQQISREQLLKFIEKEALNYMRVAADELEELDAETYLEENYYEIIKQYVLTHAN